MAQLAAKLDGPGAEHADEVDGLSGIGEGRLITSHWSKNLDLAQTGCLA